MQQWADCADELWELTEGVDPRAGYLTNQMMRAIDSTGANLAEGSGRGSPGSMRQFFGYALGSALEAQYWYDRAYARKLIDNVYIPGKLKDGIAAIRGLLDRLKRE